MRPLPFLPTQQTWKRPQLGWVGRQTRGKVNATIHPANRPLPGLFHPEHSLCPRKSLSDR